MTLPTVLDVGSIRSVGTISIPAIKLNPKDVPHVLKMIKLEEPAVAREKIHQHLLAESPTGSISFRNAVYALSFHTLRVLRLIEGKGDKLRLSVDGQILLNAYVNKGIDSFKKEMAKIVARVDRENANVLESIKRTGNEVFDAPEVERQLINMGIDSPSRGSKLTKWLRLLQYVRFIDRIDGDYKYNEYQVMAIDRGLERISTKAFFKILKNSYDILRRSRRGNPYIPIPEIEDSVCRKLLDQGFTTFDFRNYLRQLYNKKIDGYQIYLSKPGAREANGLRINDSYYYYIAIFGE